MARQLWGEFAPAEKSNEVDKIIPTTAKRIKLEEMLGRGPVEENRSITVKVKNPLVTQTIEVMKQTEMLQSLIDTYSNKSDSSNYLLNPCQLIPEVDFPPENAADFVSDDKFAKPFWFIPPLDTPFAKGLPQSYPQINADVCREAIRKAVCGQLRVAGFTDTAESALVLFADAIEEFIRSFMQHIRETHANDPQNETIPEIDIKCLEKAYFSFTNSSLTQVHNYFKHNLMERNRAEIAEFNGVLQEYDKLMKESQSMQKPKYEGDFLNMFEMSQTNEIVTMTGEPMQEIGTEGAPMLGMLESQEHMSVQHAAE